MPPSVKSSQMTLDGINSLFLCGPIVLCSMGYFLITFSAQYICWISLKKKQKTKKPNIDTS